MILKAIGVIGQRGSQRQKPFFTRSQSTNARVSREFFHKSHKGSQDLALGVDRKIVGPRVTFKQRQRPAIQRPACVYFVSSHLARVKSGLCALG